MGSRMVASASSSYGVGSAFTTMSRAPLSTAIPASEAAGCTWSVVPTAMNTSQAFAIETACPSTTGSSRSPNMMVADFRMPPQTVHDGSASPASTRVSASAIGERA